MARQYLIIDGYNLMHAAGIARPTYGRGDLQRCRQRLVRWLLEHLDESQRADTTVVFDAYSAPSDAEPFENVHGLKVAYAPPGTDADSEIERLLLQHSAPKQIILVSSDHRLHKAARRRRARPIDSEDFIAEMEEIPESTTLKKPAPKRPNQPTSSEWEKIFGAIPEIDELRREKSHDYPGAISDLDDIDLD